MKQKLSTSLKNINFKLFLALLVLGLCPTVYTTVRVFFLGQLPGDWSFSIAGQLSWVNLLYEVVSEAIILPLFYFVGKVKQNRAAFSNRVRTGMLVSLGAYLVLSAAILLFAEPLLRLMAADESILEASAAYIRIESVANIFTVILTAARLLLSLAVDTFFVSSLPISLQLGVNGVGYSNVLVNALLLAASLLLLRREGVQVFSREALDFGWLREFARIGGISGLESLVRNLAYMVMISRMVNVVGEQGTYWVANNFIWGWLLLPVLQLGELIKEETAENRENVGKNTPGYLCITLGICLLWCVSIPLWKPFMAKLLLFEDVDKLFHLVLLLLGFYMLYAFQNVFDATFYGLGKTDYMLFESVVTNTVFYGAAFVLYLTGVWTPTLTGIALLFGLGMAFDSVVSLAAYLHLRKRRD